MVLMTFTGACMFLILSVGSLLSEDQTLSGRAFIARGVIQGMERQAPPTTTLLDVTWDDSIGFGSLLLPSPDWCVVLVCCMCWWGFW